MRLAGLGQNVLRHQHREEQWHARLTHPLEDFINQKLRLGQQSPHKLLTARKLWRINGPKLGGGFNTTTSQNKPNLGTSHISLQYYLFFVNTILLQMCVLLIWNQNGKNKRLISDNTPPSPGSVHLKTISLQYGTSVKIKSPERIPGEENISKILGSPHIPLP